MQPLQIKKKITNVIILCQRIFIKSTKSYANVRSGAGKENGSGSAIKSSGYLRLRLRITALESYSKVKEKNGTVWLASDC
jgi:hypothetical protein